jgi:hypothetical protein
MTRESIILVAATLLLGGCATVVHGPYQDVRIDSNPPGATATISAQVSERGPAFVDEQKERKVTTPATVRLLRDNNYRVEVDKPGYKLASTQIVSEYDWFWGQLSCGPCEAVGALPSYDVKDRNVALRVAESVFYEYPKGSSRLGLRPPLVQPRLPPRQHLQAQGEGQRLLERLARPRHAGDHRDTRTELTNSMRDFVPARIRSGANTS